MKLEFLLLLILSAQAVICEDVEDDDTDDPKEEFRPPPRPEGDVYFVESFSDPEEEIWKRWIKSEATKDGADADVAKYDGVWKLEELKTEGGLDDDIGLVMSEAAKHYAVSSKLERPFKFVGTDSLVVQYEVNFQSGLNCGGAYVKLLSDEENLTQFHDKTPYSIMFGPDKCGMSSKVHFIIRFKNPVTGEVEEKHSKQSTESMDFFGDKKTHLFTLLIHSDGTYHIVVDQTPFLKGNLLEDFTPPIVPPQEIDDPNDKMPEGWDEREKIPDPEAVKPDDWDEDAPPKIADPDAVKPDGWLDDGPEFVPDPDASMPDDWDEEEDGEWEAPLISNPECEQVGCGEWSPPMIQNPSYKGKWKPPLIDNPEYDGQWAPRKIENPAYFEDETPYFSLTPIAAVGFELWSMNENIFFDNIIITSELAIANNFARNGWTLKHESERAVGGAMSVGYFLDSFVELANTYPYLWALYAIAIVAPFVCCAACCIKSKSKPQDEAAKNKKTDTSTPDDPQEEQQEEDDKSKETKTETEGDPSFIASADDEEGDEETKEEEEAPQSGGEGSQEEVSQGEGSQEEPEEADQQEEAAAEVQEKPKKSSTRKRKTARRED